MVITRFAPSPTGELHIGGARTALFNYLWARHNNGKFILRIEDTDRKRHSEEAIDNIKRDLEWLGIEWDNEVVEKQSNRVQLYKDWIDRDLLALHYAYIKRGSNAVYLSPPKNKDITIEDTILGEIKINTKSINNFVIRKSDGFPTYNFACVIDDYLMKITHVIRGQEHLNNCAPQQIIRDALGITDVPTYSHVSVILNLDGSKMSKRDKTSMINVKDFRDAGISPDALINYIALLGWSPGGDVEIMDRQELIERFSLDRLRKSNSKFDYKKLESFNKKYSRR